MRPASGAPWWRAEPDSCPDPSPPALPRSTTSHFAISQAARLAAAPRPVGSEADGALSSVPGPRMCSRLVSTTRWPLRRLRRHSQQPVVPGSKIGPIQSSPPTGLTSIHPAPLDRAGCCARPKRAAGTRRSERPTAPAGRLGRAALEDVDPEACQRRDQRLRIESANGADITLFASRRREAAPGSSPRRLQNASASGDAPSVPSINKPLFRSRSRATMTATGFARPLSSAMISATVRVPSRRGASCA